MIIIRNNFLANGSNFLMHKLVYLDNADRMEGEKKRETKRPYVTSCHRDREKKRKKEATSDFRQGAQQSVTHLRNAMGENRKGVHQQVD
ncbi:hypothetical protein CEXT_794451 [Caerostris extrusa]|uniref:Uncharacterized protein n=1 Tax=Caerostris extrusa TaxID=172846 RepID=A0AAV4YA81_CAEEX|nr:hypothetical protein CEXT_794451 [Caerostris extrusa]